MTKGEMTKKQLLLAWVKRISAFVLDFIIFILILSIISTIVSIIMESILNVSVSEWSDTVKSFAKIIVLIFLFLIISWYFVFLPRKMGMTLGRKILRIKDRFNFSRPSYHREKEPEDFSLKHLKESKVLKVVVKDGWWVCPACNEPSLEIYDACTNCGRVIEKVSK